MRWLQILADENHREVTNQDMTIGFKPAWFWELMDPTPFQSGQNNRPAPSSVSMQTNDPDTRISVQTNFVQPLRDEEDQASNQGQQQFDSTLEPANDFSVSLGDLEQFHIDQLSHDFFHNGLWG